MHCHSMNSDITNKRHGTQMQFSHRPQIHSDATCFKKELGTDSVN